MSVEFRIKSGIGATNGRILNYNFWEGFHLWLRKKQ